MLTARGPRGVLFDKDGTLVDFRASWLPLYRALALELATAAGRPPEFATTLLGRLGLDDATSRFLPESPLLWATNDAIAAAWAAQPELAGRVDVPALVASYSANDRRFPPQPVAGVAELLARLAARGLALGLATMDTTAQAHATAARFGIAAHLGFVTGCDGGHGAKPGPGMVLGFCRSAGLAPEDVVVVGDTPADLEMGRRAGCGMVVAVLTGGLGEADLAPHADLVLPSVAELEGVLAVA